VEEFGELPPIYCFAVKSVMVADVLGPDAVALLVSELSRYPGSGNDDGASVALFALGGAVGRVAPDATAFVHRDAAFVLAVEVNWLDSDPTPVAGANLAWLASVYAGLGPYTSNSSYQNFPDPDLPNWRSAYDGANHGRLAAVKRAYDPDNVFQHPQSI
jgi:hypothetical protein